MKSEVLRVCEAPHGRLIVIGDVHGCADELTALLSQIAPGGHDTVVSSGDMVRKGPQPERCIELWRERNFIAVCGNNERNLLRERNSLARLFAGADRQFLRRRDLLRTIGDWPLAIDFPSLEVTIVHGGFLPGTKIERRALEKQRASMPSLRWIRCEDGRWRPVGKNDPAPDRVLWSAVWDGDRVVVYGHTPVEVPRQDARAIGIDTGCVYGGRLTAAVLDRGKWDFVSVPARRRYAS